MTNEYEKQAEDFCKKYNVTIATKKVGHGKHFDDDEITRDIYEIKISREGKAPYVFNYGQSAMYSYKGYYTKQQIIEMVLPHQRKLSVSDVEIALYKAQKNVKSPTLYDVLAALTKYDPGTYRDFAMEYGYDEDSSKAMKLYIKVQEEWSNVERLFMDCLEELQEIA